MEHEAGCQIEDQSSAELTALIGDLQLETSSVLPPACLIYLSEVKYFMRDLNKSLPWLLAAAATRDAGVLITGTERDVSVPRGTEEWTNTFVGNKRLLKDCDLFVVKPRIQEEYKTLQKLGQLRFSHGQSVGVYDLDSEHVSPDRTLFGECAARHHPHLCNPNFATILTAKIVFISDTMDVYVLGMWHHHHWVPNIAGNTQIGGNSFRDEILREICEELLFDFFKPDEHVVDLVEICSTSFVVRMSESFFEETLKKVDSETKVGRFDFDPENCYLSDDLGLKQLKQGGYKGVNIASYHADVQIKMVEHEFFTWLPCCNCCGILQVAENQAPLQMKGQIYYRDFSTRTGSQEMLQTYLQLQKPASVVLSGKCTCFASPAEGCLNCQSRSPVEQTIYFTNCEKSNLTRPSSVFTRNTRDATRSIALMDKSSQSAGESKGFDRKAGFHSIRDIGMNATNSKGEAWARAAPLPRPIVTAGTTSTKDLPSRAATQRINFHEHNASTRSGGDINHVYQVKKKCHFFHSSGSCRNGTSCKFSHH